MELAYIRTTAPASDPLDEKRQEINAPTVKYSGANKWRHQEKAIEEFIKSERGILEMTTGLPCNPHTFRRTFACLLRKAGVDNMTIKDLGRWESLEMVQRYTRSLTTTIKAQSTCGLRKS